MSRIYLSPPHVGPEERALLLDAFDSGWIAPIGPHVTAFEEELAARVEVGHAAALSSGTAAIHLALVLAALPLCSGCPKAGCRDTEEVHALPKCLKDLCCL